jgi:hypothetical protein
LRQGTRLEGGPQRLPHRTTFAAIHTGKEVRKPRLSRGNIVTQTQQGFIGTGLFVPLSQSGWQHF